MAESVKQGKRWETNWDIAQNYASVQFSSAILNNTKKQQVYTQTQTYTEQKKSKIRRRETTKQQKKSSKFFLR